MLRFFLKENKKLCVQTVLELQYLLISGHALLAETQLREHRTVHFGQDASPLCRNSGLKSNLYIEFYDKKNIHSSDESLMKMNGDREGDCF